MQTREPTTFKPGLLLQRSCGRCRGDMVYDIEIWEGRRWGEFTCIQCGNAVSDERAREQINQQRGTGELRLLR